MTQALNYDNWLRKLAEQSKHPFVQDSEAMVKCLFELKLPLQYGWRVTSEDAFKDQIARTVEQTSGTEESSENVNRLYWHDMARSIEAYDILIVWRGVEFVRTSLHLLNKREVIAPSVLARSLLELAATALYNNNNIQKYVTCALASASNQIVVSTELEQLIVRMIYGTRMSEHPDYLKQTNVLTYIQRLSKHENASELLHVYEYLCDLTHPNVLGNARFWSTVMSRNEDGSETLKMEQFAESSTTSQIREMTLWALGWSSVCIRNAFLIGQDTVQTILGKMPRVKFYG